MSAVDLDRTLASLQSRGAALDLTTADLCFLVALRVRADRSATPAFGEDLLYDVHEQVFSLLDPDAGNPRKRATAALQRLREQRLLARIDGAGLIAAGQYAMTRLAAAIVDFFLEDEALTRESLQILSKALAWQLADVKSSAQAGDWADVVLRLRVAVADLVNGIERRQQGLDAQQHEVRERISSLLRDDWFAAVDACEALLDETAGTLHELHAVLLEDTTMLGALLAEILDLAEDALEAREATLRAMEQVDRVYQWGASRQAAWSDYYQYVQRYLRTVVRLDPQRAVSHRLQQHISAFADAPYAFVVAEAGPTYILRDPDRRPVRVAVTRPRTDRDEAPEMLDPEAEAPLSAIVQAALDGGARRLSEVLAAVLPDVPGPRRYAMAGRATGEVANLRRASRSGGRWSSVLDLEVEDWDLR
jgi:chromosome partition protein MukF